MHKRVERELEEIKRNTQEWCPRKLRCKSNEWMGVSPDRDVVDTMAAKIIAYRKHMGLKEGEALFQDKAMNDTR
jgi:hypothetical protein